MGRFETAFDRIVVTCEHGGHEIPKKYAWLFKGKGPVLTSHRGWDRGALFVARRLAKAFRAPLHYATVSRLLIDLNRSPRHPKVFSAYTAGLPGDEKDAIRKRFYESHRASVEDALRRVTKRRERVLHLAIHSFTPELGGEVRNAEIGLLYDPKRAIEADLCQRLAERLRELAPELRVRRNYPYVGYSDGLTTYLRRRLPARLYAGIEIEINQTEAVSEARLSRVARVLREAIAVEITRRSSSRPSSTDRRPAS